MSSYSAFKKLSRIEKEALVHMIVGLGGESKELHNIIAVFESKGLYGAMTPMDYAELIFPIHSSCCDSCKSELGVEALIDSCGFNNVVELGDHLVKRFSESDDLISFECKTCKKGN